MVTLIRGSTAARDKALLVENRSPIRAENANLYYLYPETKVYHTHAYVSGKRYGLRAPLKYFKGPPLAPAYARGGCGSLARC